MKTETTTTEPRAKPNFGWLLLGLGLSLGLALALNAILYSVGNFYAAKGRIISYENVKNTTHLFLFDLAALALGMGIAFAYWREPDYCSNGKKIAMAICRFLGALTLLVVIAKPVQAVFAPSKERGTVVILVDDSKSMSRVDVFRRPEDKLVAAHAMGKTPLEIKDAKLVSADAEKLVGQTSRLDQVRALLSNKEINLFEKLQEKYNVEVWSFSEGKDTAISRLGGDSVKLTADALKDLKAEGNVTEIGNALRTTLNRYKGQTLAGIVMITDGGNNNGEDPVTVATDSSVRIFPVGIGVPISPDVAITHVSMASKVFVNDVALISVRIKQHGYDNVMAKLNVTSNGIEIATVNVKLKELGEQTEVIPVTPKVPGHFVYKVEIQPLENASEDIEPKNNMKDRDVEVVDAKIKVLLVESDPRWEYRFLKNSLERDKHVDLSILLHTPDMAELAQPKSRYLGEFPNAEKLFEYHVVIFGNMSGTDKFFTEHDLSNLRRFVMEERGGIWFIAGKNNMPDSFRGTPLEDLIPVELDPHGTVISAETERRSPMSEPYRLALTADGRSNSLTRLDMASVERSEEQNASLWNQVPAMYWYHEAVRVKLGATALLVKGPVKTGLETPLLVTQQVGRGRVLYQGFADLWRMRFPLELGPDALERYHGHVVQDLGMPKLLAGSARFEITTDLETYLADTLIHVEARVLEKGADANLPNSTGKKVETKKITLINRENKKVEREEELTFDPVKGVFRGDVKGVGVGRYRITLNEDVEESTHADIQVQAREMKEMEDPDMRKELLDRMAKESALSAKNVADKMVPAHMYLADQAGELVKDIHASQREFPPVRTESPLWSTWPWVVLFTAFMGAEWLMRKRNDLM